MSSEIDISVIIPTYNRPHDVVNCVESVFEQTVLPHEVIIIDDGDLSEKFVDQLRTFECDQSPIIFSESQGPAGTSTARNTGVKLATGDVVLIIDDDVVLSEEYLEILERDYMAFDSPDLAGIGGFDGTDLREPTVLESLFDKVFFLGGEGWEVNRLGMQSWTTEISSPQKADWLSGNNASFKREILSEYTYPHWSGGREAFEDVAIGMKLKQAGYHCIIDPSLSLDHNEGESVESPISIGWKSGSNRVNIFLKYSNIRLFPLFLWSMVGEIIRHFLAPIANQRVLFHCLMGIGVAAGMINRMFEKIFDF